MAHKRIPNIERFIKKTEQILREKNKKERIEYLTLLIRRLETLKTRTEAYIKYLKDKAKNIMIDLGITELIVNRTFARLSWTWEIKKEKGKEVYSKIVDLVGKEKASRWIQIETKSIPAHQETIYKIPNWAQEEIIKEGFGKDILKIIGNTPRLTIGNIPQRVKKGKPKRKR